MVKDTYFKQLKGIIDEYNELKLTSNRDDLSDLSIEIRMELMSRSKTAVTRITGFNSHYYKDIEKVSDANITLGFKLKWIIGIITALESDLKNNYLVSMSELLHSELFTDYIEMASYLNK
jgi:hypothetical protein